VADISQVPRTAALEFSPEGHFKPGDDLQSN